MVELEEEVSKQEVRKNEAPRAPKAHEKVPQDPQPTRLPDLDDESQGPAMNLTELAPSEPERRATERRKSDSRVAPARESSAGLSGGDVRRFVVEQPELLEAGLRVHTNAEEETVGIGFATAVGDIDLLARDNAGGWVVVLVEEPGNSRGHGKELVGDLLQLMGWVRKHLGAKGQEVRGMVLLDSVPDDLGYAAAAVASTVEFKRYRLALSFESIDVV
jgi:hypothetical protein